MKKVLSLLPFCRLGNWSMGGMLAQHGETLVWSLALEKVTGWPMTTHSSWQVEEGRSDFEALFKASLGYTMLQKQTKNLARGTKLSDSEVTYPLSLFILQGTWVYKKLIGTNDLVKERAKELSRHLPMINTSIKKCSAFFAMRKMQLKTLRMHSPYLECPSWGRGVRRNRGPL